ncbi:MAG: hypothetical protein DDT19_01502 [Syntrophomonadaceae bacterium]|nr:hypothetical protein [Bacillota bacterium]
MGFGQKPQYQGAKKEYAGGGEYKKPYQPSGKETPAEAPAGEKKGMQGTFKINRAKMAGEKLYFIDGDYGPTKEGKQNAYLMMFIRRITKTPDELVGAKIDKIWTRKSIANEGTEDQIEFTHLRKGRITFPDGNVINYDTDQSREQGPSQGSQGQGQRGGFPRR